MRLHYGIVPGIVAVAALLLGSLPAAAAEAHPLTLAARAWGLAKYFHPQVTACAVDWDQALLDTLPALEAAGDDPAARSQALIALLDAAGQGGEADASAATPQWIRDAAVTEPLRRRLAWIAAQQPQRQCYVSTPLFADFSADAGHATAQPDRAHRALAAFRFWNAIEYFFPYRDDIGRDWAGVLDETLRPVLDAGDFGAYVRAMRVLTAAIQDGHASFAHPPVEGLASAGLAPFHARLLQGRRLVVQVGDQAGPVRPGDEILTVDGEPVSLREQRWDPMGSGSNPAARQALNLRRALSGPESSGEYTLRRPDGTQYTVTLPRSWGFAFSSAGGIEGTWETRALPGGCRMGIVDMGRLQVADVPAMLDSLADTDAIVFDVRNYPNGTLWDIVDRLYPEPRDAALFQRPDALTPGQFHPLSTPIGGQTPQPYRGRALVLFDERSISHSEYTVMGLQALDGTLTFGSQTAGADGNITSVDLPGGLRAWFTGLGVYYPDGTPTQRVGIVPDVHVVPTLEGLADGRDEVLEAALDCRWTSEAPPPRLPPSGHYYDRTRSGEGLDIHRDQHLIATLSYGYDETGKPRWLLSGSPASNPDWGRQFLAYTDGGSHWTPADDFELDFHRGPYEVACASADQGSVHLRGAWRAPGAAAQGRCVQPLQLSAGIVSEVNGLWSGGPGDSGWGVSVRHVNGLLSVFLYGYDNAGAPRWLLGQVLWDGDGPVTLPLQRPQGFCRACPRVPITWTPAGELRLDFEEAAQGRSLVDIEAHFDEGAAWTRQQTPLRRLVASDGE